MNIKYANPKSVNLIEFNSEKFASISKIYSFTTENISGYFNYLDFKNKNVLTVSASGDHIINAFYKGARSVTGFDINYLALVFTELKLIAIQELSYKQFLEIFLINDINNISKNLNALNYKQYIELREKLTENSRKILDDLYSEFNNDGYKLRNSYIFNNKYDNNSLKIESNLYLKNELEFNKAKEQIKDKEIVLVNSSYSDIALNKLPNHESYDIILMSNISDYIKDIYKNENYLEEYIKEIIYNFKSPNNQIVCAYLYNIKQEHYRSEIDNPVLRKKIFKKLNINFTEENFKSVIKNCTDSIIII